MCKDTNLSREDLFLLEEYRSANELAYHVDMQRHRLTSYFLTFVGVALAGLLFFLEGKAKINLLGSVEHPIMILLFLTAVIGVLIIYVIARLRRVQFENFRIVNNVRTYFIQEDKKLKNIVELSDKTLPIKETINSGTFYWVLILIVAIALLFVLSAYLFIRILGGSSCIYLTITILPILFILIIIVFSKFYLHFAKPPEPPNYIDDIENQSLKI